MLIVHLEPSQNMESGDYYYRTHAPGESMAQLDGVYVVNLTSLHPNKFNIISHAKERRNHRS